MRVQKFIILSVVMAAVLCCTAMSAAAADDNVYATPQVAEAVAALKAESVSKAKVRMNQGERVRELIGRFPLGNTDDLPDAALSFMERHKAAFGMNNPADELEFTGREVLPNSTVVYFQYLYKGIPVWDWTVDVHISNENEVGLVVSRVDNMQSIGTEPAVTEGAAIKTAASEWAKFRESQFPQRGTELMVYQGRLAYLVKATEGETMYGFFVDAADGMLLKVFKRDLVEKMGHCGGM